MARTVRTIPATLQRFTATPITEQRKRRTAAYARVSTDSEEQQTSYAAQVDYYTHYIQGRDDWEFVDVYTDEGITGTSTQHREGFKRMVADALAGKIDLIVTKSVSRFARNTVDSLVTVRQLKERGVEIYFEKENIWTLDSKGELLITIMSSLAQEESRSISENCTWGQRKRFADGKVTVPFKHFLGYDRGPDGNLVKNEQEAAIVRRIYNMFLEGVTPHRIAATLTAEGVRSPGGKTRWHAGTVQSILTNEKYKGDALLQKCYTVDFLTKRKKKNDGEIPQYYVTGNHEPIIDPSVFDLVQREIAHARELKKPHGGVKAFSGRIICGECGSTYGSKVWHSTDKYRRVIWRCNHKYGAGQHCGTPHLTDDEIISLFLEALNQLIRARKEIKANYEHVKEELFGTKELAQQRDQLMAEEETVESLITECIRDNANIALDQTEFNRKYDALCARHDAVKTQLDAVKHEIDVRQDKQTLVEHFVAELMRQPEIVDTFDPCLWNSLVETMTVYSKEDVRFTFRDGTTIQVKRGQRKNMSSGSKAAS